MEIAVSKKTFGNGCPFKENSRGQKIDNEGFATSSITYITTRRTCVSVKMSGNEVLVRNTEDKSKKTLSFSRDEWKAFVGGVKLGNFFYLNKK